MNKLAEFLKALNLDPENYPFVEEVNLKLNAMARGLKGEPNGLEMIPAYLSNTLLSGEEDSKVIVIDAGGTNMRIALVNMHGTKTEISNFHRIPMPGTQGELTASEFLGKIIDEIEHLLPQTRHLAFCFSFSAQIGVDLEARINSFSKEVRVPEMEGQLLGAGLRAELARRGDSGELYVLVLNDTIAALLGGLLRAEELGLEGPLALIHGTGVNSAYPEPQFMLEVNGALKPAKAPMLINTEGGNYSIANRGLIDHYLDSHSMKPFDHLFEKMTSGVYLGEIIRLTLLAASKQLDLPADFDQSNYPSFFSQDFAAGIKSLKSLSNQTVSGFLASPEDEENLLVKICHTPEDCACCQQICRTIYQRAAKLIAIMITSLLLQSDLGKDASKPAMLIVDGSTFHLSHGLRQMVEAYLKEFTVDQYQRYVKIEHMDEGNLIGAATAWRTVHFA